MNQRLRTALVALGCVLAAAGLLIGFATVITTWAPTGIIASGLLVFAGTGLVAHAVFSGPRD